ncbi:MAG: PspC domain-containing protein [Actinobacteria bacterium]|nr:PspC domain-containing protein [Actinomycetota bacterium]
MDNEETATLPPPPPPTPTDGTRTRPLRITWRRSTGDKMISGVCGGVAQRYGIDPAILRVATVVAIFAGGLGLFGYLALWLLLPRDIDPPTPTLTRSVWKLILGVLLGVVAVSSTIAWLANLGGITGLVVGGFLAGLAVWLYLRPRPTPSTSTSFPATLPEVPPASAGGTAAVGYAYGGSGTPSPYDPGEHTTAAYYPAAVAPLPAAPKERSYLGGITLLIALVAAGAMTAGAAAGLLPFNAVAFFAVLLLVIGVGLLVAAFVGRARWLIIPAVLLTLATAAAVPATRIAEELNSEVFSAGVGSPTWTPTSSSDFELGVGTPTLDLRPWAASAGQPGETDVVTADVRAGELTVLVPDTWQVNLVAEASAGEITLNGAPSSSDSPQVELDTVLRPLGEPTGELDLELAVGVGSIVIEQVPAPAPPPAEPSAVAPTPVPAPSAP